MNGLGEPGDLYELLGVARDAPAADITRAYHRRARALHPDAQPGQADEPARFQELEAAYRVLHDPGRRAAYDQALRPAAARPGPVPRPGPAWPGAPGWPGSIPPGAALWAGPAQVSPPPGADLGAGRADARRAVLALLLARHLASSGWDWPW